MTHPWLPNERAAAAERSGQPSRSDISAVESMTVVATAEETRVGAEWFPGNRPGRRVMRGRAMSHRRVFMNADISRAGAALAAVLVAVSFGIASLPHSAGAAGLTWTSPAPRQPPAAQSSGAVQQASMFGRDVPPPRAGQTTPAQGGRASSPRMAMLDGEVVMDGDMMMFDESSASAGSMGMSGGMISEPCSTCRQPPWHGNVASPYQCGPACDPCQPCDPCARPYRHACFPRLHALFGEGYLPYPMPPCEPRCNHCGMPIPVGF